MRARIAIPLLVFAALAAASPASAQIDLSGYWANRPHEDNLARGPGLLTGEYTGFPLNAAGRMKALSWNATVVANRERQCIPFGIMTANSSFRITRDVDPVTQQDVAWRLHIDYASQDRTIWMDGRPHPPAHAPHTWQGFSTGKWEANQLMVTTTHLKVSVIERNGTPRSDRATTVEHFIRRGDILTVVHVTYDPAWLEEPLIQTREFALDTGGRSPGSTCVGTNEVASRQPGYVPHYLPGTNPILAETVATFNVSSEAMMGGAATMYPEFQPRAPGPTPYQYRPPAPGDAVAPPPLAEPNPATAAITVLPVQGNVYLLAGAGGNTTVQVGDHSVVVVDTQVGPMAEKIVAAIRDITNKPIRFVVNTSARSDHTGGNEAISKAGKPLNQSEGGGNQTLVALQTAPIYAHENVLERMSAPTGQKSELPFAAWPTDTYIGSDYRFFNGEAIRLLYAPAATSDGDSIIVFHRSDVISAGDIFNTTMYPVIDRQRGGSINGVIAALNQLIDLSTPAVRQEGGTYIIPGHGRIADQADVVEYRDMVVIIRDRIADMAKRGMTLEQVKAAQPAFDYDPIYGAPTAMWTKDMFIEAVYRDVSGRGTN